ncbi:MAG: hypothetical protein KC776_32275 [Myxococcales bacterium]|nr:hypothetical protein [Myxococcales bacterium]MCB9579546.1 hypothetical protein [Polyangiaceae bacterium]
MAEHHGFADDEWALVCEAPLDVFMGILAADSSVESVRAEVEALERWIARHANGDSDRTWVRDLLKGADHPSEAQAAGRASIAEGELLDKIERVGQAVDARRPPEEAREFKVSLVDLAKEVAAASGGALSGGPKTCQSEADLIWKLRRKLDV